jgi:APA family basic amino acid/polyamine antiporter
MANQLFRKKSIPTILKEAQEGLTDSHGHTEGLKKVLRVKDLTFFGIAAVIGTGVFTAIGSASYQGGPAVILLFGITAVACGFAAYCYAEFASTVPVSGSAYTYSYVAFGEIFAWIIGWDLLMEYAIGNIAVAISWSQYFVRVLDGFHIHVPEWMTIDYFTAHSGFKDAVKALSDGTGKTIASLDESVRNAYYAWQNAPALGGFRLIMNVPALLIVLLITYVVYIGIKESRTANNLMVMIKLAIILVVIVAGAFYVHPVNWHPFMPNHFSGVMAGVSAVFFAYIGFDAISTTAEECENPQRDLPKAMFLTLIICTVLYIILTLVLTGMTNYSKLNVADPLAFVFHDQNSRASNWIAGIISVSAIFVIASVLLVYQLGQPRIWMSMSRDGLLPKVFSRIHPKYKTPSFATILTGICVGVPALFMNLDVVIALTSIGTLFAFVLVCGGVLVLQKQPDRPASKFRVPYLNSRFIMPLLFLVALVLVVFIDKSFMYHNLKAQSLSGASVALINNTDYEVERAGVTYEAYRSGRGEIRTANFSNIRAHDTLVQAIALPVDSVGKSEVDEGSIVSQAYNGETPGLHYFKTLLAKEGIPMLVFWFVALVITVLAFVHSFSLIPVLGLLSCFYLMSQESHTNWYRFVIWLVIGLVIYFSYGFRNSRLSRQTVSGTSTGNT